MFRKISREVRKMRKHIIILLQELKFNNQQRDATVWKESIGIEWKARAGNADTPSGRFRSTFLGQDHVENSHDLISLVCNCCHLISVCLWPYLLPAVSHACE